LQGHHHNKDESFQKKRKREEKSHKCANTQKPKRQKKKASKSEQDGPFESSQEKNLFFKEIKQLKKYLISKGGRVPVSQGNAFIKKELPTVRKRMVNESGINQPQNFFRRCPYFGVCCEAPADPTSNIASDRSPHYTLYKKPNRAHQNQRNGDN
jgi:hypothetical protein